MFCNENYLWDYFFTPSITDQQNQLHRHFFSRAATRCRVASVGRDDDQQSGKSAGQTSQTLVVLITINIFGILRLKISGIKTNIYAISKSAVQASLILPNTINISRILWLKISAICINISDQENQQSEHHKQASEGGDIGNN